MAWLRLNIQIRLGREKSKQVFFAMHSIGDIILSVEPVKEVLQFKKQHSVGRGESDSDNDSDLMVFPV